MSAPNFPSDEEETPSAEISPPAAVSEKGTAKLPLWRRTFHALLAGLRRVLGWLTFGYFAALIFLLVALEWWGERHWALSVLLFAPPQVFLLPLTVLTPACLVFRWRLLGWHLAAVFAVLFGYMNFRWAPRESPAAGSISAITFNNGESYPPQFYDFVRRENPDLIFLQDMRSRGKSLAARLPATSFQTLGQFGFAGKFPLSPPTAVDGARWNGEPVAVRCEAMVAGRPTALYSVHLPSPRHQLAQFLSVRRVFDELSGPTSQEAPFAAYRAWLAARLDLSRALAAALAAERLPMIVGGDFNTPDHGYVHRLFTAQMDDAFARAGRGWGLTFPGSSRQWLTFFGPWLRIDCFFTGRGWRAVECRPEPGGRSQHKAVFARFEPRSFDEKNAD